MGHSGSGKSTFMNLVGDRPSAGSCGSAGRSLKLRMAWPGSGGIRRHHLSSTTWYLSDSCRECHAFQYFHSVLTIEARSALSGSVLVTVSRTVRANFPAGAAAGLYRQGNHQQPEIAPEMSRPATWTTKHNNGDGTA
jgi:hypothetical protein